MNENEEINEKYREALQNIRTAFDESAWEKMEKLLDNEDENAKAIPVLNGKTTPGNRKWLLLLLFGLLFISGTVVYFVVSLNTQTKNTSIIIYNKTSTDSLKQFKKEQLDNKGENKTEKIITPQATQNPDAPLNQSANTTDKAEKNTSIATDRINQTANTNSLKNTESGNNKFIETEKKSDENNKTAFVGKSVQLPADGLKQAEKIALMPLKKEISVKGDTNKTAGEVQNKEKANINPVVVDAINPVQKDTVFKKSQPETQKSNSTKSEATAKKDSLEVATKPLVRSFKSDSTAADSAAKDKKVLPHRHSFLKNIGITLLVFPEVNAVAFKEIDKLTLNYGAGLSYNLGKHLTASVQLIHSRKIYTTDRQGYNPPDGSVFLSLDYLNVKAACVVWDIPVNLRYSFTGNMGNSYFISAGLSSYLMKEEVYDFAYYDQTGAYKTRHGSFENQHKHGFSNFNISAGYQYRLSKKMSAGIEPYLKLPLSGVGIGKVKLTSVGVFFNLTYRPFQH